MESLLARARVIRFSNMRRGEPRLPVERVKELTDKRHESIVSKCHPAIFEFAQLLKESIEASKSLGPNPPHELVAEIEARTERGLAEIKRKYSGPVQPAPNTFAAQIIFSDEALTSNSDALGIAEAIHFARHKTPAKVDAKKRAQRNWDASRRILRTTSELEQLRCGKGPLPPFKGHLDHGSMFTILWNFGIEKLTAEELADFFDTYCPCGLQEHDPDALKKHRARFKRILKIAVSENSAEAKKL